MIEEAANLFSEYMERRDKVLPWEHDGLGRLEGMLHDLAHAHLLGLDTREPWHSGDLHHVIRNRYGSRARADTHELKTHAVTLLLLERLAGSTAPLPFRGMTSLLTRSLVKKTRREAHLRDCKNRLHRYYERPGLATAAKRLAELVTAAVPPRVAPAVDTEINK